MNTDNEKLSDPDIKAIVSQFRDNLNCFLELWGDSFDQWKNFDSNFRQYCLIQLRRQYSPIIGLGKVIADYCITNNGAREEKMALRALESFEKMKEYLEFDQANISRLSGPFTRFCLSTTQLTSLLPEDLAITRKEVLEMIESRSS